ncbi:MAG: GTPase HflX [Gammaproteobacteria bacterium]|nr:MAG: GTPase HflX [Gammaproteobacteria bacterium]
MFDRPSSNERAVLVHIDLPAEKDQEDISELKELASTAGAETCAVVTGSRRAPDARFFVGKGKLEEIKLIVEAEEAGLVLFNHALSPSQERNIEKELCVRVVDRTGLILDIFAQRAQTHVGKLQVELAQLRHLSTRLIRGWTHLERQKGGIGMRGPGETQLETDRRLLSNRIRLIRQRLAKVEKQREQGRGARKRSETFSVSLVGYTNAGKSTLFNALTGSDVYAADQLFATLDPTLRRFELKNGEVVVLADTVGFIRHLPHALVAAFRSTLQEACDADLLLHVIDSSSEERLEMMDQVNEVLVEIGADEIPQIEVYNKIDLLRDVSPKIDRDSDGKARRVWLSALSGEGTSLIEEVLESHFGKRTEEVAVQLNVSQARLHAQLFEHAKVLSDEVDENGGWNMVVEFHQRNRWLLDEIGVKK